MKAKIKKLWKKQIQLQEKMQLKGLNIVTCGSCDTLIIHECNDKADIKCHGCGITIAKSDCPDYFYEGMPFS